MTIQVKEGDYTEDHGHRPTGLGHWTFICRESEWIFKITDTYIQASREAKKVYSVDKDTDYGIIEVLP